MALRNFVSSFKWNIHLIADLPQVRLVIFLPAFFNLKLMLKRSLGKVNKFAFAVLIHSSKTRLAFSYVAQKVNQSARGTKMKKEREREISLKLFAQTHHEMMLILFRKKLAAWHSFVILLFCWMYGRRRKVMKRSIGLHFKPVSRSLSLRCTHFFSPRDISHSSIFPRDTMPE